MESAISVFVCYSHVDSKSVLPEIEWQRAQGIEVWYDEGISAGKVWRAEIAQAIQRASRLIYYISTASLASEHCIREVNFALDNGVEVLPVYLEDVRLTPELDLALSRVQALRRDRDPDYRQHLLRALERDVEPPTQPTSRPSGKRWYIAVLIALAITIPLTIAGWHWSQRTETAVDAETAAVPTIAVLPFVNLGSTESYFSDGVAEEILNRMVQVREVRVISRNSSFTFKDSALDIREIGRQLGAAYILQGSLRRSADVVRIAVHLTDTTDGTEVWSGSYDRELTDILRLQDEIAQAAIREFMPTIATSRDTRPDVDPVAYDTYLKGIDALRSNDPFSAKPLLEEAIALDQGFSQAYSALALAQLSLTTWGIPPDSGATSPANLVRAALELDAHNIDAQLIESAMKLYVGHDLQGAISDVESILHAHPDVGLRAYFELLTIALKPDEALRVAKRAVALDPLSHTGMEVRAYESVGDWDGARRAAQRFPQDPVGPDCWSGRRCWLIQVDIMSGRFTAAEENIAAGQYGSELEPALQRMWLAVQRGDLDAARSRYVAFGKPELAIGYMPYLWIALDVILSGDTTRTLDEIENPAIPGSLIWIMRLPHFDRWTTRFGSAASKDAFAALRRNPRYQRALEKYGIDDDSLAKIQIHTDALLR